MISESIQNKVYEIILFLRTLKLEWVVTFGVRFLHTTHYPHSLTIWHDECETEKFKGKAINHSADR